MSVPEAIAVRRAASDHRAWGPPSGLWGGAAVVAVAMVVATALVAAVVALTGAGAVRDWLAFPFTGVPDRLGEAASILWANLRLAAGVGVAAAIAQARLRHAAPSAALALAARVCDAGVALALAANVAIVGAAVGAYGGRMIVAMLPHGPLELAAFALAVATHLRARHRRIGVGSALPVAAAISVLLAVAALLETYVASA